MWFKSVADCLVVAREEEMCVCVCVCACVRVCVHTHTEGYEWLCSFPPQLLWITNPLPPSFKAAGLQTVKVQSDSDRGPVRGALCSDYTKLWPHKISRCVAVKCPSCCFSPRHARDSPCATNLCCSAQWRPFIALERERKWRSIYFF